MKLRDFLDALRERGRVEEAEHYRNEFLGLYCPPLSEEQLLDLSLDDLCVATSLLKTMEGKLEQRSGVESRVFALESEGANVTYGEYYLRKKGLL